MSQALAGAQQRITKVGHDMGNVGRQLSMGLTLPIAGVGFAALKASIDFESSFAGIRKTVDATEEEFDALAQGLREMARQVPASVNELNRIGELGGQLGIAKASLLDFTRVIADMAVTTNLTAESAATAFARIANVTGLPQDQFDRLGSSIVELGNNLATTEAEIVEFAVRIAGAGEIAGLTEAQMLAIGAAMSSVGVEAEAGGTAIQKVLLGMTEAVATNSAQLKVFAATAGLSAAEFAKAFEQDAGAAFAAFVEGLGRQGDQAFGTLEELGLADQRLIRGFLSLAGAGDLVSRSLELSTDAFADNTALATEAGRRYETTASQLTVFKNQLNDVAITLGDSLAPALLDALAAAQPLIDTLKGMAEGFAALSPENQKIIVGLAATVAIAGPLLIVLGALAGAITALATPIGIAVVAITAMVGALAWLWINAKKVNFLLYNDLPASANKASVATKGWAHEADQAAAEAAEMAQAWGDVASKADTATAGVHDFSTSLNPTLTEAGKAALASIQDLNQSFEESLFAWQGWSDAVEQASGSMAQENAVIARAVAEINNLKAAQDIYLAQQAAMDKAAEAAIERGNRSAEAYRREQEAIEKAAAAEAAKAQNAFALAMAQRDISGPGQADITRLTSEIERIAPGITAPDLTQDQIDAIVAQLTPAQRAELDNLAVLRARLAQQLARAQYILGGGQLADDQLPPIPMAQGGIVTSPTVAMIGEAGPEAVVPLSRGKGALGGLGTIVINLGGLVVNGPVGVEDLADSIVRTVRDRAREGGFAGVFAPA